jgi:hypothetical protein
MFSVVGYAAGRTSCEPKDNDTILNNEKIIPMILISFFEVKGIK